MRDGENQLLQDVRYQEERAMGTRKESVDELPRSPVNNRFGDEGEEKVDNLRGYKVANWR